MIFFDTILFFSCISYFFFTSFLPIQVVKKEWDGARVSRESGASRRSWRVRGHSSQPRRIMICEVIARVIDLKEHNKSKSNQKKTREHKLFIFRIILHYTLLRRHNILLPSRYYSLSWFFFSLFFDVADYFLLLPMYIFFFMFKLFHVCCV